MMDSRGETLDGKRKAMAHFNSFLSNELNKVEVTENNIVEILSNFAAWMCNQKKMTVITMQ
jgi:hypothetical protein